MKGRWREGGLLPKNRLRELREERGLYQKDIAEILFMSQTGYSQYETGTNDIPTGVLRRLCKYYGTSIDYLLYLTDEPKAYPKSIFLKSEEVEERIKNRK